MTYKQYYHKISQEIADKEKHISAQNKALKGDKGYMDKEDIYAYMTLRNELNSLMAKREELLKLMSDGKVEAHDEVDMRNLSGSRSA
ncbi:MAG: hypothetical protein ACTHJ8_03805 [Mucilaginibacter sp.]